MRLHSSHIFVLMYSLICLLLVCLKTKSGPNENDFISNYKCVSEGGCIWNTHGYSHTSIVKFMRSWWLVIYCILLRLCCRYRAVLHPSLVVCFLEMGKFYHISDYFDLCFELMFLGNTDIVHRSVYWYRYAKYSGLWCYQWYWILSQIYCILV